MTIKNGIIKNTVLGLEGHGILSFSVGIDYGGSFQSFGGWALDAPLHSNGKFVGRRGTAFGMEAIRLLLEVLEIETWEKLINVPVRVRTDDGKIVSIGHFTRDKWLHLHALSREMKC